MSFVILPAILCINYNFVDGRSAEKFERRFTKSFRKGLKTGIYYLRTKAKAAPQQFTIEPDKNNNLEEDDEDCLMCGS